MTKQALSPEHPTLNKNHYFPGFPAEFFSFLIKEKILRSNADIASIDPGNGEVMRPFIENGNKVICHHPEKYLNQLKRSSADIFLMSNAYDHVNAIEGLREVYKVLKPEGYFILLDNDRLTDESEFLLEYESLLHNYSNDYETEFPKQSRIKEMRNWFTNATDVKTFKEIAVNNHIDVDQGGLKKAIDAALGKGLTTSLASSVDKEISRIFDTHHKEGKVRFEYTTFLYAGKLKKQLWPQSEQS